MKNLIVILCPILSLVIWALPVIFAISSGSFIWLFTYTFWWIPASAVTKYLIEIIESI